MSRRYLNSLDFIWNKGFGKLDSNLIKETRYGTWRISWRWRQLSWRWRQLSWFIERSQPSRNNKSSSRPTPTQKGQIKDGKSVQYAIKDQLGNTKYVGSTNNPTRRASQHQQSGKMQQGDKLEIQSKAITKQQAERLEAGRLSGHRREHGKNPEGNRTNDGQYHK